jgi:hypothetical protein
MYAGAIRAAASAEQKLAQLSRSSEHPGSSRRPTKALTCSSVAKIFCIIVRCSNLPPSTRRSAARSSECCAKRKENSHPGEMVAPRCVVEKRPASAGLQGVDHSQFQLTIIGRWSKILAKANPDEAAEHCVGALEHRSHDNVEHDDKCAQYGTRRGAQWRSPRRMRATTPSQVGIPRPLRRLRNRPFRCRCQCQIKASQSLP